MALSRLFTRPRDGPYEPIPRRSHCAASLQGKVFVFAGFTEKFATDTKALSSYVETFDPYIEKWTRQKTIRSAPPGFINGAIAASRSDIYHYGGADGTRRHGGLFRFHPVTLAWREICRYWLGGPMRKSGCRMVCCRDTLCLFGGYGETGFTDECHLFDIIAGTWSCPTLTGTKPSPRINFSFTEIDDHRAILFAGLQTEGLLANDAYIVDLELKEWIKLDLMSDGPVPARRNGHAACCINIGDAHPLLLVTGGYGQGCVLNDAWLLDIVAKKWTQLVLPAEFESRCFHSLTATSLATEVTVVTMFGGWRKWGDELIAQTTLLQFESLGPSADHVSSGIIKWSLTDVTSFKLLGSAERLQKKRRDIELAIARHCKGHDHEELNTAEGYSQRVMLGEEIEARIYQQQLVEAEQQRQILEEYLENAEATIQQAQKTADDAKQQLQEVTKHLQESEANFVQLQKSYEELRQENEYLKRCQQAAVNRPQDMSSSFDSHPIYGERPQLRDFIFVKWTDSTGAIQRYRLREDICPKWRTMGQILGFSHGFLRQISCEDPLKCFDAVMSRWLENGSDPPDEYPTTWQGLITVLEDVGGFRLKIKELCRALEARSV